MRPNLRMSQSPTHMARTDREKRRRQAKGMPVQGIGSPTLQPGTARRFDVENGMWTDEQGIVHNSERKPAGVTEYEVIRMGDLKIETQEALSKEEIERQLGKQ